MSTASAMSVDSIDGKSMEELREPIGSEDRLRYGDVRFSTQILRAAENERVISGNLDVQETLRIAERKIRAADRVAENLLAFARNDVSVAISVLRDVWLFWQIVHDHARTQVPMYLWQFEVNDNGNWWRVVAPCKESALSVVYRTFFADRMTDKEFRCVSYHLYRIADGAPVRKVVGGQEVLKPAIQWLADWKTRFDGNEAGPFQSWDEENELYVEITDENHVLRGGGIDEFAPGNVDVWMSCFSSVGQTVAQARESIGNNPRFRCLKRHLPPAKASQS